MTANRVSLVSDSTTTTTTVSDMAPYTGWVDGRLTFDRTPVHDVLTAVGRWYGYEFHLTDSALAARHLSASFDQQSPADMLAALQTVLNVTMTFDGHVVTLHPRRNSAAPASPRRHSTEFLPSLEVGR
jgi:transmembrane sensor